MGRYPTSGLAGVTPAALGWLTGTWLGQNGDDLVEEHWSPLRGGTLMGMFRWATADRVRFYELLAIEQEEAFVHLRIKHFHPGLVGWEERDRAAEWLLVHLQDREAAFLERNVEAVRWAIYRREGEDRLVSYFSTDDEEITDTGLFAYARQP